uniref:Acyl transferase domain-containing protein n=1 Tax=Candidatus Kentrum sp. MB TaxID=2138164 RepID=A0A451BAN4_9GAMM|nr:MAG: Acyl transferase domain-containing protein [Candidatus Kentron sp. MB]VFK75343.1 MAG: Acyl transferase domain-containing protein [Candidatus Kentron sp. MB]
MIFQSSIMDENPVQAETVVDLLRYHAQRKPNETLYTFLKDGEVEDGLLTYAQLDRKARAIAAKLQDISSLGERALLLYPAGLDFIAAFFGCLCAGVIAVPTYPPRRNRPDPRFQAIATDAGASIVLTTAEILSDLDSRLTETPALRNLRWLATDDISIEMAENWRSPNIRGDTLAFLQYTSGSTGSPKGVMVSHGNLLCNEEMLKQGFAHTEKTIGVGWLPLFHDMGLIGNVLQPLYLGFPVVLMSPMAFLQKPLRWLQAISDYKAVTSGGPNFAYNLCIEKITHGQRAKLDLSSWTLAFSGAEPIRAETLDRFAETFAPYGFHQEAFYPCYGMAETTLMVSGGLKKEPPVIYEADFESDRVIETASATRRFVGCGRTDWLDQRVIIVDPASSLRCFDQRVGEIWVSGENVAQGYWGRAEETEQTFQAFLADTGEGPFLRTGDLGFFKDGELFFTGRHKDLIIVRGQNHYPQDIELTVENSHEALSTNGVAAFSAEQDGEEWLVVVQEVQRTHLRKLNIDEIFEAIREAVLEQHELSIHAIVLLKPGQIPKTSSGKVQRRACRALFLSGELNGIAIWQRPQTKKSTSSNILLNGAAINTKVNTGTDVKIEAIRGWLTAKISQSVEISPDKIDTSRPFAHYDLDSAAAVGLSGELGEWLGQSLPPTLVYDYPTIDALARYLTGMEDTKSPPDALTSNADTQSIQGDSIAVIGLGCRFPQAKGPDEFWQLLKSSKSAISKVPASRWTPTEGSVPWGGFISDADRFDPAFFGISPREADTMDPQQRLVLEVSWEALENAGIPVQSLAGSQTGVFIGISTYDYSAYLPSTGLNIYFNTGNSFSITANRLSYLWDLHGPSKAIDTACSSSLVAIHDACQNLRGGECDLAIAGGVNLMLSSGITDSFSASQLLSPGGCCNAFDAKADGYVRGEGCGMVILKRTTDAIRDADPILAIVKGSAVNQDGRTNGITAPNGPAQQMVVRKALANAGVSAREIGYVETHGTGTPLGDPIEFNALKEVLTPDRSSEEVCYIGSVKTNIGHLEAAAGIAGVIKTVLVLQHREIPPHPHFDTINPHLDITGALLSIPTKPIPWLTEQSKFAGVSSFGFGGTNAHAVLASAPVSQAPSAETQTTPERPQHILTLSAQDELALPDLARAYTRYFQAHPETELANACFTAAVGRSHFTHRLALVAASSEEAIEKLQTADYLVHKAPTGKPKLAFLFTGQGSEYVDMGRQLYETEPTFRKTMERCDEILRPFLDVPLIELLYAHGSNPNAHLLKEMGYLQPTLFALEYSLSEMWKFWGITPNVVMGHSAGEYVAACVAGVFSLEDGLKFIASRGRLMQTRCERGAMLALSVGEKQAQEIIAPFGEDVSVATINSPESVVVSGRPEAITSLQASLAEREDIDIKLLPIPLAAHSAMIEPMLPEFEKVANSITYAEPVIPVCSNVSGKIVTDEIAGPGYWLRHLRQPVRFAEGVATLHNEGFEIFLEVGPKPALLGMARQCLPDDVDAAWLPSLREGQEDWRELLRSLGEWHIRGGFVDWDAFDRHYPRRKVQLPTYPFQRQRYWADKAAARASQRTADGPSLHPLLHRRLEWADADNKIRFESLINFSSLPYLADHCIFDTPVVPGTAYLEIGLAAGAAISDRPFRIKDQVIDQALILSEEKTATVQVVLSPEEQGYRFQIFDLSEESYWTFHGGGHLVTGEMEASPNAVNLSELQAVCTELSVTGLYQTLYEHGFNYGPAFQAVKQVFQGKGRALSRIELPESLRYQVSDYRLHPILLDAAFHATIVAISGSSGNETYMMTAIKELQIHGHAGTGLWSLVEVIDADEQTILANVSLFDDAGLPIARVNGFTVARVKPETLRRHFQKSDDLYEIAWQARPIEMIRTATDGLPGCWLIFADGDGVERDGLGLELVRRLEEAGGTCLSVYAGETYEKKGNNIWQVDPTEPEHFEHLLTDVLGEGMPPWKGTIHLWGLNTSDTDELTVDSLEQAQVVQCGSVLHLLQAQIKRENSAKLWLVTRNAISVGASQSPLAVAQSPMWGLGKSIAWEYPNLWGGLIDNPKVVDLLAEIMAEEENQVAYRNGVRYAARVVKSDIATTGRASFQPESSYLITGGLGGLGIRFAHWMVMERGVRYLVLMGRQAPSEEAREFLKEMEETGARVLVVFADVSDSMQMVDLFQEIDAKMPPLKGIIHSAGVLDDGVLAQQNLARFKKTMAPKIAGTWNLHALTRDRDLDFFVCFSSIASLLGSTGQANHASASAFMDTFVYFRHQLGLPALSINWGAWADFGAVAEMAQQKQDRLAGFGIDAIDLERGTSRLDALLGQSKGIQVAVSPMNWSQFLQQFPIAPPFLSELVGDSSPTVSAARIKFQLEEAPKEKHEEILTDYLRNGIANVLKINPSQLNIEQPLNTMGLDSLMAIELKNRVRAELDVDIPIATLMEDIGIVDFARKINTLLGEQSAADAAPSLESTVVQSIEEEVLARLDSAQLTEEEIDALFNEHFSDT